MNCVATDFLTTIPFEPLSYVCVCADIYLSKNSLIDVCMYVCIYYVMSYTYLNSFVRNFRYKNVELYALLNKNKK